jgi:hypothetical protein
VPPAALDPAALDPLGRGEVRLRASAVFGFSTNPVTRLCASMLSRPNPAVSFSPTGMAAMVTSARVARCVSNRCRKSIRYSWSPLRMSTCSGFSRSMYEMFCRTASAVPWYQSALSFVCWAASTSTNPLLNMSNLYVLAMCRCRLTLRNWVST